MFSAINHRAQPQPQPQPHVVFLTFPTTGHTNPILEFAKNITGRGLMTTIVSFPNTYEALVREQRSLANTGLNIRIECISDGRKTGEGIDPKVILPHISLKIDGSEFESLIRRLNSEETGSPVCYIVYDHFIPWARKVALSMGISHAMFWTFSATMFSIHHHFFFHSDESLSKVERAATVPGLELSMEEDDLPDLFRDKIPVPDKVVNMFKSHVKDSEKLPWVLANSFYELEKDAFHYIKSRSINFAGVGPCLPRSHEKDDQESDPCIQWLNKQSENSVMYISFGSMSIVSKTQVEEMAHGLKESGQKFIWVIRGLENALPSGFEEDVKDKGLLVKWCDQIRVLFHPSVGGFLSHCGWNSALEAACAGVPVTAFPLWTDQFTNSKVICDMWRSGVRLVRDADGIVERKEIARCVKELLCEGKEMRSNAKGWKEKASFAMGNGGSSDNMVSAFVEDVVNQAKKTC